MPFDRSIDMQVSRLRKRLGDNSRDPRVIKTMRNEGYVLDIVAVRWLTRLLRLLAEAATKLGRALRQARSRSDRISSTMTRRLAHAVTGAQLTWRHRAENWAIAGSSRTISDG